jgi:hypothetical protein
MAPEGIAQLNFASIVQDSEVIAWCGDKMLAWCSVKILLQVGMRNFTRIRRCIQNIPD